jgi:hypothetical protein
MTLLKIARGHTGRRLAMSRQHDKILAILYIFNGAAHTFILICGFSFTLFFTGRIANFSGDTLRLYGVLLSVSIASLIAGYALAKNRYWRTPALVASSLIVFFAPLALLSFVISEYLTLRRTLISSVYWLPCFCLTVYSIWFLFRKDSIAS